MLKFFRRLRRQLLIENRFSKYLLYAIGEIILVVIGILIALRVNNANLQRLDNAQEAQYLTAIQQECRTNSANLATGIQFCERILTAINYIVDNLDTPVETLDIDSLNASLGETMLYVTTTYIQDTYREMQSSGHLSLIRSDSIKNQITAINSFYDQYRRIEDDSWHTHFSLVYIPFTSKHLNMQIAGQYWSQYSPPGSGYDYHAATFNPLTFWSLPPDDPRKLEFANIMQVSYGGVFYAKISAERLKGMSDELERAIGRFLSVQ